MESLHAKKKEDLIRRLRASWCFNLNLVLWLYPINSVALVLFYSLFYFCVFKWHLISFYYRDSSNFSNEQKFLSPMWKKIVGTISDLLYKLYDKFILVKFLCSFMYFTFYPYLYIHISGAFVKIVSSFYEVRVSMYISYPPHTLIYGVYSGTWMNSFENATGESENILNFDLASIRMDFLCV